MHPPRPSRLRLPPAPTVLPYGSLPARARTTRCAAAGVVSMEATWASGREAAAQTRPPRPRKQNSSSRGTCQSKPKQTKGKPRQTKGKGNAPRCEALRVLIEERHVQPREGLPWRELLEHDGVLRLRVLRLHVVHQAAAVDGKVALEGVGRNRDIGALVRQAEEKQLGRVRAEEGRLADRVHLQLLLLDLRQRRRARIEPEPILPDVDEAQAVVARLHVGLDQRDVRLIRAQHEAGNTCTHRLSPRCCG
eukprot:scaffold1239_cov175-Pinguiococcus_pyrenoidosus.AAC.34